MAWRPADTSEAAWAVMEAGIARMSPAERVHRAASLTVLAHAFALAQIRRDHPGESERMHQLRLAARWLDEVTMRKLGLPDEGGSPP